MRTLVPSLLALVLGTACQPSMSGSITVNELGQAETQSIYVEGVYRSSGDRKALKVFGQGGDAWFELWRGDPNTGGDLSSFSDEDWISYDDENTELVWPEGNLQSFSWTVDDTSFHRGYAATMQSDTHQIVLELGWDGSSGRSGDSVAENSSNSEFVACYEPRRHRCAEIDGSLYPNAALIHIDGCISAGEVAITDGGCPRDQTPDGTSVADVGVCANAGLATERGNIIFYPEACSVEVQGLEELCSVWEGSWVDPLESCP